MAYYYVRDDGTATGDGGRYASQQTGSFAGLGASGYYGSVEAAEAATTSFDFGDFICVSDAHDFTHAGGTEFHGSTLTATTSDKSITFMTVSDANVDQYAIASSIQEQTTSASFYLTGNSGDRNKYAFLGLNIAADGQILAAGSSPCFMKDCTFTGLGASDSPMRTAGAVVLENCHLHSNGATNGYYLYTSSGTASISMKGGSLSTDQTTNTRALIHNIAGTIRLEGVDMSATKSTLLVSAEDSFSHFADVQVLDCALSTSLTDFMPSNVPSPEYRVLVANSATTSAAAEYQYYYQAGPDQVEDETSIYRDGSTAFPSGQRISLKYVTGTAVSQEYPFVVEAPTRFAELSNAASDVLRVYILSSAALTDADIRVEVIYPDGTNKHISNIAESSDFDPFATGTTLTTNTEAWTGRTAENRYHIDIDTSGDAGADCVPSIRVHVAKPSATIYFCPTIGLS